MIDLQKQISEHYQKASQIEITARQLEGRIARIPGAKRHIPSREYGSPVDMQKVRSNLTLSSLIAKDCPQLSAFCGIDPSIHHRMQEQKEAIELQKRSLQLKTEQLAAQNQEARKHRETALLRGVNPVTGRRFY